jgi:3-phenylpropionate/trans-cinnamate dioxygenase ferredoxin subunit
MDKHWSRLRSEVPHLKRSPSEYINGHVWFTTQPMEEPGRASQLIDLFDRIGWDPPAVLDRLSALGFRRSALRLQGAAQRGAAHPIALWQCASVLRDRLMARHVVATVDDIAPGQRKLVQVQGRDIGIFNVGGEFFAIADRCPHEGASLCKGPCGRPRGIQRAGVLSAQPARRNDRCPGIGWEFDLRTGKSWCDRKRTKGSRLRPESGRGRALVEETLLRAETFRFRSNGNMW